MKCGWVLLGFLLRSAFATDDTGSTQQLRRGGYQRKEKGETTFPSVYTALVPSLRHSREDEFVAALDLLNATPNDKAKEHAQLTFLIHSQQELEYLTKLALSASIKLMPDEKSTKEYIEKATSASYQDVEDDDATQTYSTIYGFPCYRNLEGMEALMTDLVHHSSFVPNLNVTLMDIGDSYLKTQDSSEGYDIWALNITGNGVEAQGRTTEKGIMFVMTGIHAREYAPPELAARFAMELVQGYGNDAEITSILDHTEVHLVLHSNPDGRYQAEIKPYLYRRKNMNGNATRCGEGGYGVDLNRNFPFKWGFDSGSSSHPCSAIYRGEAPASEPEVQAIVNYVSSIFPEEQRKRDPEIQIDEAYPETVEGVFLDIHSYGEVAIWPWAYENRETPNDADFESLVGKFTHFNNYGLAGPNMDVFYAASGATDDWAYGELGAAAVTFELGTQFYEDCEYFENNIVPGNMLALMYAAKTSRAPYTLSKGPDVTSINVSPSYIDANENSTITVTVEVSDSAYSSAAVASSQQAVSSVRLFVDTHPYDVVNGSLTFGTEMDCNITTNLEDATLFQAGPVTATLSLSITDLAGQITTPVLGSHTVYVQGTDSNGYKGPVTAAFFRIVEPPSNAPDVDCEDSSGTFSVEDDLVGTRDCDWLAINTYRFGFLCELVDVGVVCPSTCNYCELFG